MADTALRSRVERLLRGDMREQDLHHLFFNMRDETRGSGVVSEVTNFVAHPRRTQGMATKEVRDLFETLKFILPLQNRRICRNGIARKHVRSITGQPPAHEKIGTKTDGQHESYSR